MKVQISVDDGYADLGRDITEEWWKGPDGVVYRRLNGGEPEATPYLFTPVIIIKTHDPLEVKAPDYTVSIIA